MSAARPAGAVPVAELNTARLRAQRLRAEWQVSVNSGLVTPTELIEYATTDDGRPLRVLRLRDLLMSQPHWGATRADAVLTTLRCLLDVEDAVPSRRLTVGWLLDNRTGGRRFDAFLDAITTSRISPWPGFPLAAAPVSS